MKKRILCAALSAWMLVASLCVPAAAAVEDKNLQKAAELNTEIAGRQGSFYPITGGTVTDSQTAFVENVTARLEAVQAYLESEVESDAKLKIALIDYDIVLAQVKRKQAAYEEAEKAHKEAQEKFRTGEVTSEEVDELAAELDKKKQELAAVNEDMRLRKDKVEILMGGELPADYDFASLYKIIDVSKVKLDELPAVPVADSICTLKQITASGQDAKSTEAVDLLRSATELYFTLGTSVKDLVVAAKKLKTTEKRMQSGLADETALATAQTFYDETAQTVATAKAGYAKTLIELDSALGGALLGTPTIGTKLKYVETLPDSLKGEGLWQILRAGDVKAFYPFVSPEAAAECDTYAIVYDNKEIGRAKRGESCALAAAEYVKRAEAAYVVFYREGEEVIRYQVDVFSPLGTFMEVPETEIPEGEQES